MGSRGGAAGGGGGGGLTAEQRQAFDNNENLSGLNISFEEARALASSDVEQGLIPLGGEDIFISTRALEFGGATGGQFTVTRPTRSAPQSSLLQRTGTATNGDVLFNRLDKRTGAVTGSGRASAGSWNRNAVNLPATTQQLQNLNPASRSALRANMLGGQPTRGGTGLWGESWNAIEMSSPRSIFGSSGNMSLRRRLFMDT